MIVLLCEFCVLEFLCLLGKIWIEDLVCAFVMLIVGEQLHQRKEQEFVHAEEEGVKDWLDTRMACAAQEGQEYRQQAPTHQAWCQ